MDAKAIVIKLHNEAVEFYKVMDHFETMKRDYHNHPRHIGGMLRRVDGPLIDELYVDETLIAVVDRAPTAPVPENDPTTFILSNPNKDVVALSIMHKDLAAACVDGRFNTVEAIVLTELYYANACLPKTKLDYIKDGRVYH